MMKIYLYDSTFNGLLSAIHVAFYSKEPEVEIIREDDYLQTTIQEVLYIPTNQEKSDKVAQAIKEKISLTAFNNIYYAYLSEYIDAGTKILAYLRLGFKKGSEIDCYSYLDEVKSIHGYRSKVLLEKHRMLGFVRFQNYPDYFLSIIEPDHNILHLIMPHFVARLPKEKFIILDKKRQLAGFYNGDHWRLMPLTINTDSQAEDRYTLLWQEYFKTIAIKERSNTKLQKKFMPARYWKHLTEYKTKS